MRALLASFLMPIFSALVVAVILGLMFIAAFLLAAPLKFAAEYLTVRAILAMAASFIVFIIFKRLLRHLKKIFSIFRRIYRWAIIFIILLYLCPPATLPDLLLLGVIPFITGCLLSGYFKDELPLSSLNRLWPLILPAAIILLTNFLIIPGVKEPRLFLQPDWMERIEPFYSRGWDHLFLSLLMPAYAAFWLGFYLSGERRKPSAGKARALLLLLTSLAVPYTGNLMAWQWSTKDILPFKRTYPQVYDSSWSFSRDDYISSRSDSHLALNFPSYFPHYKSVFEREPKPTDRVGGPGWPYLYINWPLFPFHEAAHWANDNLDYGDPGRYIRCDYMFSDGTGFSFEAMGETEALRANAMAIIIDPGPEEAILISEAGMSRTLIAREALVFMVHHDNPLSSLSLDDIALIFSGRIENWRDLGGPDEKIMIFQRPMEAKSTAILKREIMGEHFMPEPIREFYWPGCDGALEIGQAVYRNYPNAIGYALRWPTVEQAAAGHKLLSINGVAPSLANLESGRYPLTIDIEMVLAEKPAPEIQLISQWLTSPNGREFIRKIGFAPMPLNNTQKTE